MQAQNQSTITTDTTLNIVHISTLFSVHELISNGLPPPPNASGLLLAVCSALLVNTVALPLLTAVLTNEGSTVVELVLREAKDGSRLADEVDEVSEVEGGDFDVKAEIEMVKLTLELMPGVVVTLELVVCRRFTVVVETDEARVNECIVVVGFVEAPADTG